MNIGLLDQWAKRMKRAWETRDSQAAADLCSDKGFEYYENPFQEPFATKEAVRDSWSNIIKNQTGTEFNYKIMATTKRGGVVHWWTKNIDGVFAVKLDPHGLCTEFRQWWMEKK